MTNILADTATSNGWRMFGTCLGLCGGLLCAVLGSLLTVASWATRESHNKILVHQWGGVLLSATIPLLLLGGFCLDWLWPAPSVANRRDEAGEED